MGKMTTKDRNMLRKALEYFEIAEGLSELGTPQGDAEASKVLQFATVAALIANAQELRAVNDRQGLGQYTP